MLGFWKGGEKGFPVDKMVNVGEGFLDMEQNWTLNAGDAIKLAK